MKNLPEFIILDIKQITTELKQQLEQNWLFTVDIEFVLQIVFTVFEDVANLETNLEETLLWFRGQGFELKAENTNLQLDFVLDVIKATTVNIYDELVIHGYLNNATFPYRFQRILFDGSVYLTKIYHN